MFAISVSVCRAAAPLRNQARRYASGPAPSSFTKKGAFGRERVALGLLAGSIGATAIAYFAYPAWFGATIAAEPSPVAAAAPPASAFTGGEQGFISLVLEDAAMVNHNTKLLRFKLPEDGMVSGLHVASALLTKFQTAEMEKPVIRPYTPISEEDATGHLDLLVKKYPTGLMSTHMHDMQPGQRLDFKGPIPKYPWTANKHEHIALLAGGTGITPMFQLTRAVLSNPADRTRVTLVFGNVAEHDILLRDELTDLENTYPQRFRAFYVLSHPDAESWTGARGYITPDLLKSVLPEPAEGDRVKIFVCGPPGMVQAISGPKKSAKDQGELNGMLKDMGYSKDQVFKF